MNQRDKSCRRWDFCCCCCFSKIKQPAEGLVTNGAAARLYAWKGGEDPPNPYLRTGWIALREFRFFSIGLRERLADQFELDAKLLSK